MSELFARCCGGGKKGRRRRSGTNGSGGSDENLVAAKQRLLRANDRDYNNQFKYADNYIITSKYNLFTFIPKNLFEQFQRLANTYFLFLLGLQLIPWISSIIWYTTAVPLLFVLTMSALKDAYDDIQRHRSDRQVNNRISYVVRDGRLVEEKWMNVKVGDIVRMENEHFIAADLLLLSTSEPHGLCYIETAELDGETNLKTRAASPETADMGDIVKQISAFRGHVTCEAPNNRLDTYEGRLEFDNKMIPLNNSMMLLRGCRLRNTRWCYGVVVFAGKETKLMMNSGRTKFKRTSLDRFLNVLIMGIVLFLIAMCLICTILCGVWEWSTGRHFTAYLDWDRSIIPNTSEKSGKQIALIALLMFFSYIILLNTVVPISLYVSVEVLRFAHSMFINFDREMYYEKNDVAARARTTTLNEELGQVQYIFSDKTGTLTQNIMTFNKCSINGRSYGDLINDRGEIVEITDDTRTLNFSWNRYFEPAFKFYDRTLLEDTRKGMSEVTEFWRLLAICHTVMPERKAGNVLEYQAQSPDEAALTSAARNFGFVFKSRTPQSITIEVNGRDEVYQVLHILDFDNNRKRMSVLSKDKHGRLKLYCKGADTMILGKLHKNTSELLRSATTQHLDKFAADGLRTLCCAYKEISNEESNDWLNRLKVASTSMVDRQRKLDELYEEMEQDMTLLGATAIEDKLQDGVPETIFKLSHANIKIWVLTGDKMETAINIGYSCRLLTEEMKEVFVVNGKEEKEVEVQLKSIKRRLDQAMAQSPTAQNGTTGNNVATIHGDSSANDFRTQTAGTSPNVDWPDDEERNGGYGLVISGESLEHALKPQYARTLLDIGCMCTSVICCRVTPLQKAEVVNLVKRNKKAVTLAIGDGANDVSMIKTAHIGVGISGQEGMQAVLSSDYSIGQFKYLQRLLLVHGRWSYYRMAKFLRYFFYKNFSFTLTHFWYSFFCGYSAQTVYDPILISMYNLFFTALPVLVMGILDQDVSDKYSLKYAKLYIPGQYNLFFNMRTFVYSVLHGMISSLVLFFVPYGALYMGTDHSGRDMNDYPLLAFTIFTALIIVVTMQIMLDTAYWTLMNHVVIWGSLLFYFVLVIVYYEFLPVSIVARTPSATSYGVAFRAMSSPHFWFSIIMVVAMLILPVVVNRFFWFHTHPTYADRLRVKKRIDKELCQEPVEVPLQPIPRTAATRRSRRSSLRSGYAFSHSQGFGDLIAKGKLFKNIENLRSVPTSRQPSKRQGPLSPVQETPPGVSSAAATLPELQRHFPSSSNSSQSRVFSAQLKVMPRSKQENKTVPCQECGHQVVDSDACFKYHVNTRHLRLTLFRCAYCPAEWQYDRIAAVNTHMKKRHPNKDIAVYDYRKHYAEDIEDAVKECFPYARKQPVEEDVLDGEFSQAIGVDNDDDTIMNLQRQQAEIVREQMEQPLVTVKSPLLDLVSKYEDGTPFFERAEDLAKKYKHVQFIRGDGNCFYRAVLSAALDFMQSDSATFNTFCDHCDGWMDRISAVGYTEATASDICEYFTDAIKAVKRGTRDFSSLMGDLTNDKSSNNYVSFLRLISASFLREKEENYKSFLTKYSTMKEFCENEVEPMGKDADHLAIIGLANALRIPIRVEYLDQNASRNGEAFHDLTVDGIDGEQAPSVTVLFTPGHYDVLYKK